MDKPPVKPLRWVLQKLLVGLLAAALTLATFLVLPLLQTLAEGFNSNRLLRSVETTTLAPPPPPTMEEEEPPEEEPPPPPKLDAEAPPLDLSALEVALDPGFGDGLFGDFTLDIAKQFGAGSGGSDELDKIFSLADLDQKPRPLFQRAPRYPPELRRSKRGGTVKILFVVDQRGRVVDPKVIKSSDPAFDSPALEAIRQWKFEPGTRNGQKVQFKMSIPITFNAS